MFMVEKIQWRNIVEKKSKKNVAENIDQNVVKRNVIKKNTVEKKIMEENVVEKNVIGKDENVWGENNLVVSGQIHTDPIRTDRRGKGIVQNFIIKNGSRYTFPVTYWGNENLSKSDYIKLEGYLKHDVYKVKEQVNGELKETNRWNHKTYIATKEVKAYEGKLLNSVNLKGVVARDLKNNSKLELSTAIVNSSKRGYNHIAVDAWREMATKLRGFKVGQDIEVNGRVKRNSWQDKNGVWCERFSVVANEIKRNRESLIQEDKVQKKTKTMER